MTRKEVLEENRRALESIPEGNRLFLAQMLLNMIYDELLKGEK